MIWFQRVRAASGLAVAQLRHYRRRTILAVLAVTGTVVAMVILAALGLSLFEAGTAAIESIGGDVWVTPSSLAFRPAAVGGIETNLQNTHERTRDIAARDDVVEARGIHFQTVYVGTDTDEYETVVGTGVTGDGAPYTIEAGATFSTGDTYYADGHYNGSFSGEVLIDEQTAATFDVEVGEELHIGGTVQQADQTTFEVVGITNDISQYLGVPTVVLHLAELQDVTTRTRTDPGSAILVATDPSTDPAAVRDAIAATYPDVTVRTTEEQFAAILGSRAGVLGGASAVLLFAVVGGIAIVANVFGLLVYQQRRELAALQAVGVSSRTLSAAMFLQGGLVGGLGGLCGVVLVLPSVRVLNRAVLAVTGFDELITVPLWTLGGGGALAISVGTVGGVVAGVVLLRAPTLRQLGT